MTDRTIEQAVLRGTMALAKSPGFTDDILEVATAIGADSIIVPSGQVVLSIFRLPGDIMAVARHQEDRSHWLAMPGSLYRLIHDPFRLTREFPALFTATGELPTLNWIHGRPIPRTLADLQQVLREGDGPTLLGTAQVLVDGGRVGFVRPFPDQHLLEHVWMLLPDSVRGEVMFSTFAKNSNTGFNLAVMPMFSEDDFPGFLSENQAGDYPEGRYELALQMAVESEDEALIQELFARRSGSQAIRLAWTMLLSAIGLGLAMRFIPWEKLR
jgi:hypothetical protein